MKPTRKGNMMRKAFITAIVIAMMAPVAASAEEPVLCATIQVDTERLSASPLVSIDDGLRWAIVGHYLWIKNSPVEDSYENVVSHELNTYPDGTLVTACTDFVPGDELITEGTVDASVTYDVAENVVVVVSSDAPHPAVAEVWIEANHGFYIL